MKAGNAFTIEPMISEGNWRDEHWVIKNILNNRLNFTFEFIFFKIKKSLMIGLQ